MKRMTKGAIVTGLGVALLLGGGGTLATWQAQDSAEGGKIVSGNLNVYTSQQTPWTSELTGKTVSSGYKIVPGETLKYRQAVNVELDGDGMAAALKVTGLRSVITGTSSPDDGKFGNTLTVPTVTVTAPDGTQIPTSSIVSSSGLTSPYDAYTLDTAAKNGTYIVEATLTFNADNREDVKSTLDLTKINFLLEQLPPETVATAPAPSPTATPTATQSPVG